MGKRTKLDYQYLEQTGKKVPLDFTTSTLRNESRCAVEDKQTYHHTDNEAKELHSQISSSNGQISDRKGFQDEIYTLNQKLTRTHEKLENLKAQVVIRDKQVVVRDNRIKELQNRLIFIEEEKSHLLQLQEMISEIENLRDLLKEMVTAAQVDKALMRAEHKRPESEIGKFRESSTREIPQNKGREDLSSNLSRSRKKNMKGKLLFIGFLAFLCLVIIIYFFDNFGNNESITGITNAKETVLESITESDIKPDGDSRPVYEEKLKLEQQTERANRPEELTEIKGRKELPKQIINKKFQQKVESNHLEKGLAYYHKKRWDMATKFLQLYLKQNPSNTEVKDKLTKAKLASERAVSLYKKARERDKNRDNFGALELYKASHELYPELYDTWERIKALK